MSKNQEVIHTRIWEEIPEADNPFAAAICRCAGYDVYGDLLGKASWIEYLYLLFKQERPTPDQAALLEGLAVALANAGPRDPAVHAAMCAGTGGSTRASALMAALAVGAGQLGGAREVALAMEYWQACNQSPEIWGSLLKNSPDKSQADVWLPIEHPPGFDPHGVSCSTPVRQTLSYLAGSSSGIFLSWLLNNRIKLESIAKRPLSIIGVAAAGFLDIGLSSAEGEMMFLLLRLPGAAVHALEQENFGWRRFPFFADGIKLENDPTLNS